uniref:Uncharacterized protein n=1 Tax=Arundo donax TaxID=35708 RepID=A0A0A9A1K7_ARUDO
MAGRYLAFVVLLFAFSQVDDTLPSFSTRSITFVTWRHQPSLPKWLSLSPLILMLHVGLTTSA